MSFTNNQNSVLFQLRDLIPKRPLTQFEAYRLAELQANHLLRLGGVNQPGTPDELITGQSFLRIALRNDLPISGLTNWYKPRWLIVLNSTEPAVRRRFTLAHEFKHVLDHPFAARAYPNNPWQASEERAERVADSFLMPRRLIKRRFFQGLHDTGELAAEFGVSPQAMRYRLEQLGLIGPIPRCDYPTRSTKDLRGYFRRARVLDRLVVAA